MSVKQTLFVKRKKNKRKIEHIKQKGFASFKSAVLKSFCFLNLDTKRSIRRISVFY